MKQTKLQMQVLEPESEARIKNVEFSIAVPKSLSLADGKW